MKKILAALLALCAAAAVAAADDQQQIPLTQDAASAILQEISASQLGTLTVADVMRVAGRLSVAVQAQAYIRRVSMASILFPGAGQLMTGDTLGGVLFLTGDLAVMVGAVAGAYFLLPADLQFGSLDYYMVPLGGIRTAWESHSVKDYLPSFGVMAGGMLLKGILGHVSARLAAQEARKNIASGRVTFTPSFDFGSRGLMMGFRMRM
jgi:hypothetical protein